MGVFPEQAANWDWLAERLASSPRPPRVLNLFAYTGGSTLAAAAAGCEVSHVDAAATSVAWARRNALASSLEGAPIRWLVEHALTFVRRELKRGRRYDAVILDPPTYGHGPKGQPWKLSEKLPELLGLCTAHRRPAPGPAPLLPYHGLHAARARRPGAADLGRVPGTAAARRLAEPRRSSRAIAAVGSGAALACVASCQGCVRIVGRLRYVDPTGRHRGESACRERLQASCYHNRYAGAVGLAGRRHGLLVRAFLGKRPVDLRPSSPALRAR